jgi:large subunit ribosomal protein L32e
MTKRFLRRDAKRFSKFGKGRDKRAKWRRPTGRDNKMREKRKGYDAVVSLGYSKDKATRGKFEDKTPIEIFNVYELQSLKEDEIGVLGSVGMKKKLEVAKENKIKLKNLNAEAFLKKYEKAKKKEKKE